MKLHLKLTEDGRFVACGSSIWEMKSLPLEEFNKHPVESKCVECADLAARATREGSDKAFLGADSEKREFGNRTMELYLNSSEEARAQMIEYLADLKRQNK